MIECTHASPPGAENSGFTHAGDDATADGSSGSDSGDDHTLADDTADGPSDSGDSADREPTGDAFAANDARGDSSLLDVAPPTAEAGATDGGSSLGDGGADGGSLVNDGGNDGGSLVDDGGVDGGSLVDDGGADGGSLVDSDAGDAPSLPEILAIFPSTNVAGDAILLVGTHLEGLSSVLIGGQSADIVSLDPSVPTNQKVVVTVPSALAVGNAGLEVRTDAGATSARVPFVVAASPFNEFVGPTGTFGIAPLQTAYPPIDRSWSNECVLSPAGNFFTLSLDAPADGANDAAVAVGFTGSYAYNDEQQTTIIQGDVTGYYDEATGLFHMSLDDGGTASYVGAYSDTGSSLGYRLVLFPSAPGHQLTLFVCPTLGATDWTQCASDDGGLPTPGPASCSP